MHTFLIFSQSKENQEKAIRELLLPFKIANVDITRISPQNTIGIAIVRELKHKVALKPFKSQTKVVILEDAQTLTIEAQNALLKTLEEPPAHTIIILTVSTNIDALLPTIVSRCQVIQLPTNNKQLTTEELSTFNSQLSTLVEDVVGKRFALAENIGKDRETATEWLKNMILTTREKLLKEASQNLPKSTEDIPIYLQYLKAFQRAHMLLTTTNVNPRFTLEILFLSLHSPGVSS